MFPCFLHDRHDPGVSFCFGMPANGQERDSKGIVLLLHCLHEGQEMGKHNTVCQSFSTAESGKAFFRVGLRSGRATVSSIPK